MVVDRNKSMSEIAFSKAQLRSMQTAGQRAEALRGKGFLAFEVDGAIGRITKKTAKDPDMTRRVASVVVMTTLYLAHMRRRMARGRYATRPAQYDPANPRTIDGKRRLYLVSQLYVSQVKGARPGMSAPSSADWHKGLPSPGVATGGLLHSWQATSRGASSAAISAQGSSIGSTTSIRTIKAGERGNRRGTSDKRKAGKFVRNQHKALSVWKGIGVNPVQPTDDEIQAIASSIGVGLHRELFDVLNIQDQKIPAGKGTRREIVSQLAGGADRVLYQTLTRRWVR